MIKQLLMLLCVFQLQAAIPLSNGDVISGASLFTNIKTVREKKSLQNNEKNKSTSVKSKKNRVVVFVN